MEIAAFKVKSHNLPMLTFGHSNLNEVQLMQTQFCWIHDFKVYKRSKFNQKRYHMREI